MAAAWTFVCTPPEAHVLIDEVDQGVCLLWSEHAIGLAAGTHRLRVEKEGYLPFERELAATGRREQLTIPLRLRPE